MAPAAPHRRTWPERVAIAGTIAAAVVCFVAAGSLAAAYMVVRNRDVVEISNPAEREQPAPLTPVATEGPAPTSAVGGTAPAPATQATVEPTTTETFPPADPTAKNFLITGADNGACVDPASPFAPAFGDAESGRVGERSDTIMVFRVDPGAGRMAVLSFPRDLFVTIADTGNRARINSAYIRDEPQRLIDTIYENFGVGIDHFIQVDFCTFKTLVDAVGGVTVPFDFAARDPNTGLNVPTPGCFTFDGDHALAYVRSRKYEFEFPVGSNEWHDDESSDLGRISRQQDFLRRTLSSLLAKGLLNPSVAAWADRLGDRRRRHHRHRPVARQAARVRRRAARRRARGDPDVPDRVGAADDQRGVRARAADRGRQHAGRAGDVPRRDVAGRGARAGLRPDDATRRAHRRPRRRHRSADHPSTGHGCPAEPAPAENVFGIVPPRGVEC